VDVADLGKSNDVDDRMSGKSLAAPQNCTACCRWMIRLTPGSTISFYVVAANARSRRQ